MKLCGSVNWCKIGWLVVFFNLLFCFDIAWAQNNPAPIVFNGIPTQHTVVGSNFSYTIPGNAFMDPNGDPLTYTESNLPSGFSFDRNKNKITGTSGSEGTLSGTIIAFDGTSYTPTTFSIVVHPADGTYPAFSMNNQTGCGFQRVVFEDLSNNADTYLWKFGNGNESTTSGTQVVNYTEVGDYTVTLTINDSLTYSDIVHIRANPSPTIDSNNKGGCEPYQTTLTSGSAGVYYHWYSENLQGNRNLYTTTGSIVLTDIQYGQFNVRLEVTDENGCTESAYFKNLFVVNEKPTARFTYDKTDKCNASITNFYNTSTISGGTINSHSWRINGIQVGTNDTLLYDFSTRGAGTYIVSLVETSDSGCVSSVFTDTVKFNQNNSAKFSFLPKQACFGTEIAFTPEFSGGIKEFEWVFEGNHVIDTIPSWKFSAAGQNQVQLNASFTDGCVINVSKQVPTDNITASFDAKVSGICINQFRIDFSNTSTSAIGSGLTSTIWSRDLGGGNFQQFSTDDSPSLPGSAGTYTIKLDVTDATGCTASKTQDVVLSNSTLSFTVSGVTSGCEGAGPTSFSAILQSEYDSITTYLWKFGDGNSSIEANPSHTYSTGNFDVTLEVTTANLCTYYDTITNAVQFANKPEIDSVLFTQANYCLNSGVDFHTYFKPATTDQLQYVSSENPSKTDIINGISGTSYTYNHKFKNIGNFNLTVVAVDNGCSSDPYTTGNNIRIDGPKASFSTANSFCNVLDVHFSNGTTPTGAINRIYLWNFGDDSTSTETSPTHHYNQAGDYTVTLTATDTISHCSDSQDLQISIYSFTNVTNIISADISSGCTPLKVEFTTDLTGKLSSNFGDFHFEWDFGDGTKIDTITSNSIQYTYTKPGSYPVRLHIIGNGCDFYTEYDSIKVLGPKIDFNISTPVCSGSPVTFTNLSTQPAGGTAESYLWDFGDENYAASPSTTFTFPQDGTHTVSLKIRDSNNCTDSLYKTVSIEPFTAGFSVDNQIICNGSTVIFQNLSTGNIAKYELSFGDGEKSTNPMDTHTYKLAATYTPKLEVSTANGCKKTDSLSIYVVNATAEFSADTAAVGCAPQEVIFTPVATDDEVVSYLWDFGDGVTREGREAKHVYQRAGSYTVSLTVVFACGSVPPVIKNNYINVKGAIAKLNYDGTAKCSPDTVEFKLSGMKNVDFLQWDFGNGKGPEEVIAKETTNYSTFYTYTKAGYTKPSVLLTSNECAKTYAYEKSSTDLIKDPVRIYTSVPPKAAFTVNYDDICQGIPILFTDASDTLDYLYPASKWLWAFNDVNGGSDTLQNTSHAYSQVGNVSPRLIVSNSLGCSDTVTATNGIFLYKKSELVADFSPPSGPVCPNSPVNFDGTVTNNEIHGPVTKWLWSFGDRDSAYVENTTHAYNKSDRGKTLDVLLVATDSVQCSDTITRTVEINNLKAVIGYSPQPVYRGGFVDFSDESVTSLNDNVNTWEWHFENGSIDYSASKNPQDIQYNDIRTNNVQLTVTSQMGCIDTVLSSLPILNNPPELGSFDINTLINTRYNFSVEDFEEHFTDRDSDVGQKLEGIKIASLPDNGELYLGNSVITGTTTISRSEISELYYISTNEGADDFLWNATDGTDYASGAATVNIQVNPIPPAPTLESLVFNIREDSVLIFSLSTFRDYFTNSMKFDGFSLNILKIETIFTSNQGTLTYNSTPVLANEEFSREQIEYGYFTVTPTTGYDGKIIFYWNGFDSLKWGEDPAKVIINYINSPPVLDSIVRINLKEDSVQSILYTEFLDNNSDSDLNDKATMFFLDIPLKTPGTFKINNRKVGAGLQSEPFTTLVSVYYIPDPGYDSTVQVRWGASDGQDTTFAALRFEFVNTPPVAIDFTVAGKEDQILTFEYKKNNFPFYDIDEYDKLDSIRIITLPENGVLIFKNEEKNVIDTITGQYSIKAKNIPYNLQFIPNPNWNGTTSFQYSAFDGTDWSANEATVFITIANVNDPPTPQNDTCYISEDKKLIGFNVMANDSDIDDSIDSLTVSIVDKGTAGLHGKIELLTNDSLNYTPDENFNGKVWFTYNLCDLSGLCSTATVTIFIKPENDRPVAVDDENSLLETTDSIESNSTTKLLANDYDIDHGDSIYVLKINNDTKSKWGTLDWQRDGSYTYYNNMNATDSLSFGEEILDQFPYTLSDSNGATATAILTFKIFGVNDNPKANNDTLILSENDASAILTAGKDGLLDNDTDIDGDGLSVTRFGNLIKFTETTSFGAITWDEKGSVIFKPRNSAVDSLQEGELVTEKFRYLTSDQFGGIDSAWLFINIEGVNDVPTAFNDSVFINEDTFSIKGGASDFSSLLNNDDDIDGDSIIITLINNLPDKETEGDFGKVVWDSLGNYTYYTDSIIVDTLAQSEFVFDSFNYTLIDNNGAETTAKLIIEIAGINDPPKALPDTYFTKDVNPIIVIETDTTHILYNDSDVDGHRRKLTSVNESAVDTTMGKYGTLNWDSTGSFTYQPYPAFAQSLRPLVQVVDTFTYTVADEFKAVDDTLLYYIIEGINNAPIARNDTLHVSEDEFFKQLLPLPGLLKEKNVTDPDLDTLNVLKINGSENDSIDGDLRFGYIKWDSAGKVVYYPYQRVIHQLASGEYVTETFSYTIVDEGNLTAHANLIVRIMGENDSVYANDDYTKVFEDSTLKYDVVENDEDVDNYSLGNFNYNSLTILTNPRHGKATSNTFNGEIIYLPKENYVGRDSLKYQICDTGKPYYCDEAWLYINVLPINDPPQPINLELTTPKNTPVGFEYLAQFIDIDDGINPVSLRLPSGNSKVKKQGNQIIYTPEKDSVGIDEFTYSMKDYYGDAAYVIVQMNVFDSLSNFEAQNDNVSLPEDQLVNVEVAKNDTLGAEFPDPRTVEIRVVPRNGVALFDTAKLVVTYKPDPDFYGSDSLTYILYSGYGTWSSAKVYIEVNSVNDHIVAFDDAAEVYTDSSAFIPVLANDFDPEGKLDTTSFKILQGPSSGTPVFSNSTGKLKYKPNLGFKGIDSLVYKICDSDKISSSCDTARVFIVVKSDVFSAKDDYYITNENIPVSFVKPSPFKNDLNTNSEVKVDSSTFKVVSGPLHGKYSFTNGVVSYTPAVNYFGDDNIIYSVSDNDGNIDLAKINIWVNEVNTAPFAVDDNAIVTQNTFKRLRVLDNDYDIDGTLKFSTLDTIPGKGPRNGEIQIDNNTGTILYKPFVNKGNDQFTYKICDNQGVCDEATVYITIQLETTIYIWKATKEDTPVSIGLTPEMVKRNLTFPISTIENKVLPKLGDYLVTYTSGVFNYTPKHDLVGNDTILFTVWSQNRLEFAHFRIYITIIPVNDAPVAIDDTIHWINAPDAKTINFDSLLVNDYDIDGDQILLTDSVIKTGYDKLHVVFNADSTITITADTILWCEAWFTYEIRDKDGLSDTAKVTIWPKLAGIKTDDDRAEVDENSQSNFIDVLANDQIVDNQRCTIDTVIIITQPKHGMAIGTSDNFVDYIPSRHYYGADSLEYLIADRWGQTSAAWIYIIVHEKNLPPVAVPDIISSDFGTTVNIPVLQNDYDPDAANNPDSQGDPNAHIDSSLTHLTIDSYPIWGTVVFNQSTYSFVYTHSLIGCDDDHFNYTIFDNEGDSATTTVTINLPDLAPLFIRNDEVKTYPGVPLDVFPLRNDSGYFFPYIERYTQPLNGSISVIGDTMVAYRSNPDFMGRDSMTYTVSSECGNEQSAYIIFKVEELRVPEIISPNGDGKNDVLIIDGIDYFPDNLMQIFNRYGHVVYQKKTYDNSWGGYSNKGSLGGDKRLPAGTYYYTLIYNEGRNRQAGFIYLFW